MNEERQRIILYGDSLVLAGVQATLDKIPNLEVITLDQPLANPDDLCELHPAAVIFDLEAIQPGALLSLFQQPRLLLIGIHPETHQTLVWSGKQAGAVVAADLISVIRQQGSQSVEEV